MDLQSQLSKYRETHLPQRVEIGSHTWSYFKGGAGSCNVVILPGVGGCGEPGAEVMFPVSSALEKSARVTTIGFPPDIVTLDTILSGLVEILDKESIDKAIIVGHSAGGMFAQGLMASRPDRVCGLVIANSAFFMPARAVLLSFLLHPWLVNFLEKMLIAIERLRFIYMLRNHSDRKFWLDYLDHALKQVPHGSVGSGSACMMDFTNHNLVDAEKIGDWDGPVLIIESDNDTGFTRAEREHLKSFYPNAKLKTIQRGGHFSYIVKTNEFNEAVIAFVAGVCGNG